MFESLTKWFLAKAFFRYVVSRLIEPSSLRSLTRVLTAFGVVLSDSHQEIIFSLGAFISEVLLGVASPDRYARADRWVREYDMQDADGPAPDRRTGFEDLERWER